MDLRACELVSLYYVLGWPPLVRLVDFDDDEWMDFWEILDGKWHQFCMQRS